LKNSLKRFLAYVCFCGGFIFAVSAGAQEDHDPRSIGGGDCAKNAYNCVGAPNPLPPSDTVWIEEMTWFDVRDAVAGGKTTVIIPAGGIEPNGPWIALGKHDYIVRPLCEAIARKLGNALCAPVVPFVPEGDMDAKTGHMKSPGTIGVREETYEALLTDIAHSVKAHGFHHIILIGDHGGDEDGMKAVAAKLQDEWKFQPAVFYIAEYYKSWDGAVALLYKKGLGKAEVTDGLHDDPTVTGLMMITDPKTVRWKERVKIGKATIDGVSIANEQKTLQWGRELLEYRASVTADAITKTIAGQAKTIAGQADPHPP
jgi:creatinine amidohydrolase/Fe(II)-dependent formamide hydrolase-like protein